MVEVTAVLCVECKRSDLLSRLLQTAYADLARMEKEAAMHLLYIGKHGLHSRTLTLQDTAPNQHSNQGTVQGRHPRRDGPADVATYKTLSARPG